MLQQDPFPTLEEVQERISKFRYMQNWDLIKIQENPNEYNRRFIKLITENLNIFPYITIPVPSGDFSSGFFRLRKPEDPFNEELISEYSYPPILSAKEIRRANLPYHPVFYCSENAATAIYEFITGDARLKLDAYYYLSKWILKDNTSVRICPFILGDIPEANPYKKHAEFFKAMVRKNFEMYPAEKVDGVVKIYEFLSNLFIDETQYPVTSNVAHSYLYTAPPNVTSEIFMYPSIQTDKKSVNFAILPSAINEKFVLKKVLKIKINSINEKTQSCSISILKAGTNINSQIHWTNVNQLNDDEKVAIKKEFK